MSDSRERRLLALVEAGLALPTAERRAFLEGESAGDPELVERACRMLLTADEPIEAGLGARIEAAIGAVAASAVVEEDAYPERIGPYEVRGVLGRGGMGVVLEAHQEEPVARDVAVKLIRAGVHAPTIVARFHAERQTLASLVHPNIAKLHDAGRTPEGLPYFVMELIRGEPITDYCDARRLGLDERIGLFRTLLGAVQHAHQRTIVHRDLKPSNVLVAEVDGRPVLKVIDFGIARVATPEAGMTGMTTLGGGTGTLEYMSPEQLLHSGHGADTRSDVYSLGVVLYELVTGRLPFEAQQLRNATPSELERLLLSTPVPRASRRTTEDARDRLDWARARATDARSLGRRIKGDLDTIIEVAMAPDPGRRYATVAGLDEDLERFQEGHPITARPRTWGYRAGKFVLRNRFAVAASVAALLVVTTMGIAFTARLAEERDRASLEAQKAQEVAAFLESLFEAPDPASPETPDLTARELLDAGAARLEEELASQPVLQGALFAAIGRTYNGLGLWDESEAFLERAIALSGPADAGPTLDRADMLHDLGRILTTRGDLDRAEVVLREALSIRRDLLGPADARTAEVLGRLSLVHRGRGDYEEAEALGREAVSVLRASSDSLGLADALHTLAFTLRSGTSLDEAEVLYREALAIRRALLDPAHPDVLQTMNNLSLLLEAKGDYSEAEALSRVALEARRERLGPEHPTTLQSLNNLAYLLWRRGEYARASELFDEAVQTGERVHGGDDPGLAIGWNNVAVAKLRLGALEEAEAAARRALAMNHRVFGQSHPRIAGDMLNLGRIVAARGRLPEADSLHVAAVAMHEDLVGLDHPNRADALSALAETRIRMGRIPEAVELLEEALRIRLVALGPDNPRTAQAWHDLGAAHLEAGARAEAEPLLRRALDARRAALGSEHPEVAVTLTVLGRLLRESSRVSEARTALDDAGRILRGAPEGSEGLMEDLRRELGALDSAASGR